MISCILYVCCAILWQESLLVCRLLIRNRDVCALIMIIHAWNILDVNKTQIQWLKRSTILRFQSIVDSWKQEVTQASPFPPEQEVQTVITVTGHKIGISFSERTGSLGYRISSQLQNSWASWILDFPGSSQLFQFGANCSERLKWASYLKY